MGIDLINGWLYCALVANLFYLLKLIRNVKVKRSALVYALFCILVPYIFFIVQQVTNLLTSKITLLCCIAYNS